MDALRRLGKLVFGSSEGVDRAAADLIALQGGALYTAHETSAGFYRRRLVVPCADLVLVRTAAGTAHAHELCVRVSGKESGNVVPSLVRAYPIDETGDVHRRSDGDAVVFVWRCGDDALEYVVDGSFKYSQDQAGHAQDVHTQPALVEMFHLALGQCLYEAETGRPAGKATAEDLSTRTRIRESAVPRDASGGFVSAPGRLYAYDRLQRHFASLHSEPVTARVTCTSGAWRLSVVCSTTGRVVHAQDVDPDATTHADRALASFVWCVLDVAGALQTLSLRFVDEEALHALAMAWARASYAVLNEALPGALDERFLLSPFDVEMPLAPRDAGAVSDISDDGDQVGDSDNDSDHGSGGSEGDGLRGDRNSGAHTPKKVVETERGNTRMAVGAGRSFVANARTHAISVLRHTADDAGLELAARISNVRTARGEGIEPAQVMLHDAGRSLLVLDPARDGGNRVYRVDLCAERIVDEWRVRPGDDGEARPVAAIVPESRHAGRDSGHAGGPTVVGMDARAIFRIDPRVRAEAAAVDARTYATKTDFTCGATTASGAMAVASARGEIRLFDRPCATRAKTLLPGFGDAITGIDTTADGRYVVATTRRYLLFFSTASGPGADASLGFAKAMGDAKPTPTRLQLRPAHAAHIASALGPTTPLAFTPARFDSTAGAERAIVTSIGPFVVTWNVRRVVLGHAESYTVRQYAENVVEGDFSPGGGRAIVVALPGAVAMLSQSSLRQPDA